MEIQKAFFYFLLFSLLSGSQILAEIDKYRRVKKLFVFGDSSADTGNINTSAISWKYPYGMTYPGAPTGRYSDGRVSTDYAARFLRVKKPVAYALWKAGARNTKHGGMNFAYGGTGVFDTKAGGPNMTTQIDSFQKLIDEAYYTPRDIESSIALVSVLGNDYANDSCSYQCNKDLIKPVVAQIESNLRRINSLGVKRVAVAGIPPSGCIPIKTSSSSYQFCNQTDNAHAVMHNLLLQKAVARINYEAKDATFVMLDLYDAFIRILTNKTHIQGPMGFENPLKPCCDGIEPTDSCGIVDDTGKKKYTICENPKAAFFWDGIHLTDEGWKTVYEALQPSLKNLVNK